MIFTNRYFTSGKGILSVLAGFLILIVACNKESQPADISDPYKLDLPEHFPEPWYTFANNPVSERGVALGRRLFYDPMLSENNKISCASCHHQAAGFSDPGMKFSLGTKAKPGMRNSPALANLAWMPHFMADGGINHIEVMPLAPLLDSLEMNEDLINILIELNQHAEYPSLFHEAFGVDSITDQLLLYALAQFMSSMISANSKYDKVLLGIESYELDEFRGYQIFKAKCGSCHKEPLLSDFSFRNNGLDSISEDPGRKRITLKSEDHGKFKVPGLRNVALSYPYMHDGRFNDLMEVIDHYNEGLAHPENLDDSLKAPMKLSVRDKQDLLAFLHTLTDYEYLYNTALSDPG